MAKYVSWAGLFLLGVSQTAVSQSRTSQDALAREPVQRQGLSLNQIGSCIVVDQLPWIFRRTERRSRLLVRDRLRLSTQADFAPWEIHQVQDRDGYVSYVFRRPVSSGGFEAIVTKETHYNRIIENNGQRRIVDTRNLSNSVDRTALVFYSEDNSLIEYLPGSGGRNTLVITYSESGDSARIAPVMLRGTACARVGADGKDPFLARDDEAGDGGE